MVAEEHGIGLSEAAEMFADAFPASSGVKLELRETSCGRGLVATSAIAPGETLLSVPWKCSIHVLEDGSDTKDDVRLALELLRVLNDGGDGEGDPRVAVWRDYSAMLPISTGAAAFWTPENIKELQLEVAVNKTLELRHHFMTSATRHSYGSASFDEEAEEEEDELGEYEEFDDGGEYDDDLAVGESEEVVGANSGRYSREEVLWALGMVHSRSFSVPVPGGRARALVPYCDLFNHRSETPVEALRTDAVLSRAGGADVAATNAAEPLDAAPLSEPWAVVGLDDDPDAALFEMRSSWAVDADDEVFISYGHETSAELLTSYGFFPQPNAGDFVEVYEDVQDLLDDDRWVQDDSLRLMMEKESVMWSMLAVDAPLAVRPGGVTASAHLLGCLRLMHVGAEQLDCVRDADSPATGHSTFVWTDGPPGGMWDLDGGVGAEDSDVQAERDAVDAAALGQAAARCVEMLEEFPTSLDDDEEMLRELEEAMALRDEDDEDDEDEDEAIGVMQYVTAVRYRIAVKRILREFVEGCQELGVEPSEY